MHFKPSTGVASIVKWLHFVKKRIFKFFTVVEIGRERTVLWVASCLKFCGNCPFPQNFHTRESVEVIVFYVVIIIVFYVVIIGERCYELFYEKIEIQKLS